MGHPDRKALVETTILALIPVLFLNFAAAVTFVIGQLQPDGSPEETLWDGCTVGGGHGCQGVNVVALLTFPVAHVLYFARGPKLVKSF